MPPRGQLVVLAIASIVEAGAVHAQARPQGTPTSVAAARRAIDALWTKSITAAKSGDAAALTAMYTADAVLIDPSMATITGRASIGKMFRDLFATAKLVDYAHVQTAFDISGDLAVENGTYTETVQERGKSPEKVSARYTLVFKNVGGQWLIARDVATPMPPARAK
jgi:uncharacterized protein (TIGR02246 family)